MRKSQEKAGRKIFGAGIAAAVSAAAVVAGTASPAFATTVTVTLTPTQAPTAGGTTLTVAGTGAFTVANTEVYSGRFVPSTTTCSGAIPAVGASAIDAGTVTRVDDDSATVVTPALPASTYKLCLWDNYASTLGSPAATSSSILTTVPYGTLNTSNGQIGDKITVTNSSAAFSGTTYATQLVSGVTACPTTYTAASSSAIVAPTTKTSTSVLTVTIPTGLTAGTSYYVCSYSGTTATTSPLIARGTTPFGTFDKTLPTIAVNPTGGSSGDQTTVTVAASGTTAVYSSSTPGALVTRGNCPSVYVAGSGVEPYVASVTKISGLKLAVTMPATVVVGTGEVTTTWNVCTYAGTTGTSALVSAPGLFSVAPVLDVTGAQFAVGSAAAAGTGSGPAQGGSTITISGLTGIPMAAGAILSASLGGSPINNLKALSATEITGTTSAHAAGPARLSVTTAAGTETTTTTPYTYTYGITVTPNIAATNTTPVLDITGAGFGSLTFGTVTTTVAMAANRAYVLLTDNVWNAQTFTANTNAQDVKAVSYCNSVLPISDTEIICTLDLANSIASVSANAPTFQTADVPVGTYTVTVVNAGTALKDTDYDYSIVSSGSTFTVAPY